MTDNKLIALLTNNDDDVYCFRLELIQAILDEGFRMLISCPDGPKFEVLEEEQNQIKNRDFIYDDPSIDRRGTNIFNDGKLLLHYWNLFLKNKPSVILTYTAKPNVYANIVAKLLHIPVISNVTGFGSVIKEKGLKKDFILWLFKKALRCSSCVMFQNVTNMKFAKELGMVAGESVLIPGSGVSLTRFPLQDYPDGGDGKTGEKIVFNYLGRILHDKGVDDYIEAAKRIKPEYPNTEFNMIGFIEPSEMHYKQELEELEKNDTIFYRGSQKDVKPWIIRSHAIIHPSIYGEGMSNVLLENASSGRPIITTDNPGCIETVDIDRSGFIYHGGNVDELVEKIKAFLKLPNSERIKMGLEGRRKMEQEFNRQIVVDEYLKRIKKLLD